VLIAAKQKKVQDTLISLLRSDIAILTAYQEQVTLLKKEVRKWKNKTRWTALAGIVLTVATIFIFK
jgi:hypothetical protein